MWLLPWHVTMSADRKAVLTALGIALGATFAFVGLAVPETLDALSSEQDDFLKQRHDVVLRLDGAPFGVPPSLAPKVALQAYAVEATTVDGRNVTLAYLRGVEAPAVDEGAYLANDGATPPGGTLELTAPAPLSLRSEGGLDLRLAPIGWLLVTESTMRALDPGYAPGRATYLLVTPLGADAARALRDDGFSVHSVPALESFFRASGAEVAFDLILVVAFSSVLIALFSYEFLRSEVRERRREIGLWRGIGLRSRDVGILLVGRATAIALAGTTLGLVLAVTALGLAARVLQIAVLRAELSFGRVALVFAALVLAGALGGLLPALAASRRTVRESLEAGA